MKSFTGMRSALRGIVPTARRATGQVVSLIRPVSFKLALAGRKLVQGLDRTALRDLRELVPPISKEGINAKEIHSSGFNAHVSAMEFEERQDDRPEYLTPSTVIVSGGWAEWELEVPRDVRKQLLDMTLRIETIRTHGMLHSPRFRTSASVIVNHQRVDRIYMVKPHPHGEDYGVDSRRPFPVFRYIKRDTQTQIIRIEVDEDAFWDIDRITLEPLIVRREIRPVVYMLLGAIISAGIGAVVRFFSS